MLLFSCLTGIVLDTITTESFPGTGSTHSLTSASSLSQQNVIVSVVVSLVVFISMVTVAVGLFFLWRFRARKSKLEKKKV